MVKCALLKRKFFVMHTEVHRKSFVWDDSRIINLITNLILYYSALLLHELRCWQHRESSKTKITTRRLSTADVADSSLNVPQLWLFVWPEIIFSMHSEFKSVLELGGAVSHSRRKSISHGNDRGGVGLATAKFCRKIGRSKTLRLIAISSLSNFLISSRNPRNKNFVALEFVVVSRNVNKIIRWLNFMFCDSCEVERAKFSSKG